MTKSIERIKTVHTQAKQIQEAKEDPEILSHPVVKQLGLKYHSTSKDGVSLYHTEPKPGTTVLLAHSKEGNGHSVTILSNKLNNAGKQIYVAHGNGVHADLHSATDAAIAAHKQSYIRRKARKEFSEETISEGLRRPEDASEELAKHPLLKANFDLSKHEPFGDANMYESKNGKHRLFHSIHPINKHHEIEISTKTGRDTDEITGLGHHKELQSAVDKAFENYNHNHDRIHKELHDRANAMESNKLKIKD